MEKLSLFVATAKERDLLAAEFEDNFKHLSDYSMHLVGLGPISSAANTAAILREIHEQNTTSHTAILLGIAGSFDLEKSKIGMAYEYDSIQLEGVGVHQVDNPAVVKPLGFSQWVFDREEGSQFCPTLNDKCELIFQNHFSKPNSRLLLTASSSSGSMEAASQRLKAYPSAQAEDMESFGFAMSSSLAKVPWRVLRGISNEVGQADYSQWQVAQAISSLAKLLNHIVLQEKLQ